MFTITGRLNDLPQEASYVLDGSVKIVSCKYDCGGFFIVTTMRQSEPSHLKCAIERAVEHNTNLHNHRGEDWRKYLMRLGTWVNMQLTALNDQKPTR